MQVTRQRNLQPGVHKHPDERDRAPVGKRTERLAQAALLVLGLAGAAPALAALGDEFTVANSIPARGAIVHALSGRNGIFIHESVTPAGTTVREYVGADRRIFAVTWQGPQRPDLRTLLGDSFARFNEAAARAHAAHLPLDLRERDLVARSAGHMRSFRGCAWLPGLLPEGVTARDIE